ncbi:hypothetical protein [Bradyrhizobium vignae]|uniref:hypothetical protein n=1 Tax=Bradyrhizobium vignae TaxID=1549949 RepID=UPI00100BF590|nr:hypothetical protein [Bradyrhizobium vignae]RXH05244.1 hypothetical protein EAV90_07590 [Bradyrhizobium vignae]
MTMSEHQCRKSSFHYEQRVQIGNRLAAQSHQFTQLVVAFATRRNWNPYDVTHTHFAIVCARRSDLIETAEFAFACAWSFTFAVESFRI